MLKFRWQVLTVALLLLVLIGVGCTLLLRRPNTPLPVAPVLNVHLTLGNPSDARSNVATNANNYLMLKPEYALSYNNSRHIPNWSSWQVNSSWLGSVPRSNDFRPDPSLPQGWYAVKPSDYTGSGYDRGHLTPSADRGRDAATNSATFFMTNIVPQTPDNNRGPWQQLESYSRELVSTGKELYVLAGGYGSQRSIGPGAIKIAVPAHTWKVIVVLDQPGQGVAGVTPNTRVIAVDIPNVAGIKETDWRTFRVSVDQLESKTGYDFLDMVADTVQQVIERRVDQG